MVAWGATVNNSLKISWFHGMINGGSVLYAPLTCGSVHIDDVAAAYIMAASTPLSLCWADQPTIQSQMRQGTKNVSS